MRDRGSLVMAMAAVGFLSAAALALVVGTVMPPLTAGTRECLNLPQPVCARYVASLEAQAAPNGGLAGYRVTCIADACTLARGEVRALVLFGDGTSSDGTTRYVEPAEPPSAPPGGPPTDPPLPVMPECRDVPQVWCEDFARSTIRDSLTQGEVVERVTVWCATTCTEAQGDLSIRVVTTDGRVIESEGSFSYRS